MKDFIDVFTFLWHKQERVMSLTMTSIAIIIQAMQNILQQLEKKKCWKSSLKTQCRRNSINPNYASCFTIVRIRKFFQNPPQLKTLEQPRLKSSVWLENQLKAFQWLLICLSTVRGILIKHFGRQQWQELANIFNKDENILEYEGVKLISEKEGTKRKWEEEESKILCRIIKQRREEPESNKWNQIARKLFQMSRKRFFRTGKQCRERWLNHLDPSKRRGEWEPAEDRFIASFILEKGKKWSEIAKKLQNQRTEHMVKNRYKTIILRLKKQHSSINNQQELLHKLLQTHIQSAPKHNEEEDLESQSVQEQLDLAGLPILGQDHPENDLEDEFEIKEQEIMDRINPSNFRDFELQQVVTPCPIIYQSFTPTFLNTPHPVSFLCSFGKNDNLFLKNI